MREQCASRESPPTHSSDWLWYLIDAVASRCCVACSVESQTAFSWNLVTSHVVRTRCYGPSISGKESTAVWAREEPGEVRMVLPGDSPQASRSSLTLCPPVEFPDEFERLSQGKFNFSFAPAVCHLSPHALMQQVPLQASNDACWRSPVPSFVSGSFGRSGGQGTLPMCLLSC